MNAEKHSLNEQKARDLLLLHGFFQHDPGAADVDLVIVAVGHVQFPEGCGQMLHHIDARHTTTHHFPIGEKII